MTPSSWRTRPTTAVSTSRLSTRRPRRGLTRSPQDRCRSTAARRSPTSTGPNPSSTQTPRAGAPSARAWPTTRAVAISSSALPETGKPLDRSKLVRRFRQALEGAEVHQIAFHELRHTFGTRMAAAGRPMRTLGDMAGGSAAGTKTRPRWRCRHADAPAADGSPA
ncbi:MAG: tyrosine-type recombinase/integrase [Solirubrobacterales bacterium]|nr:tyrosine-type recombinase/integrase [Solirubrobacterales bacterium]MBV9945183.1 tyrosine-type recombinase/integrase [Solirubrobacterales bacterium]